MRFKTNTHKILQVSVSPNNQYPGLSEARIVVSNETASAGLRAEGEFTIHLQDKSANVPGFEFCTILVKVSRLSQTPSSGLVAAF